MISFLFRVSSGSGVGVNRKPWSLEFISGQVDGDIFRELLALNRKR